MLTQKTVQVGPYSIRYLCGNSSKRNLLFLHGLGRKPVEYSEMLSRLEAHYSIIAPELYGLNEFNPQPRSLVEYERLTADFCKALGIRFHAVVGHSTGATVGLSLAAFGDRFVAVNPIMPVSYGVAGFIKRALEIEEAELTGAAGGLHGVLLALREETFLLNALKDLPAELALVHSIAGYSFSGLRNSKPILVLYGLPDEFFQVTLKTEEALHAACPKAQMKVLVVGKRFKVNHEWPLLYPRRAAHEVLRYLGHPYAVPGDPLLTEDWEHVADRGDIGHKPMRNG